MGLKSERHWPFFRCAFFFLSPLFLQFITYFFFVRFIIFLHFESIRLAHCVFGIFILFYIILLGIRANSNPRFFYISCARAFLFRLPNIHVYWMIRDQNIIFNLVLLPLLLGWFFLTIKKNAYFFFSRWFYFLLFEFKL